MIFNFKQKKQSIVEYTRKRDQLNAKCFQKFEDVLSHQFIVGLDDKRKIDLVQIYLEAAKLTVKYTDVNQAVKKAYQRLEKLSSFDNLRNQPFSPFSISVQSELGAFFQAFRVLSPIPICDNPP